MNSTNTSCVLVGCRNFSPCNAATGACTCTFGLTGQYCSVLWSSTNQPAFDAWRFTFVALNAVLVLVFVAAVVEFWMRGVRRFPRMNREQVGLSAAFVAVALSMTYHAWDPFRAVSISSGTLTAAQRVGSPLVANVSLSFTAIAWVVVLVMWVHVRAPLMGKRAPWEVILLRVFVGLVLTTFVMACVCSGLVLVIYSTAEAIYYAYLGVLAFIIGVVILTSASLTYRQLLKFKTRHGERLGRLATHVVVCGVVIVAAIIVLLIVSLLPSANASFGGFYGFRCWLASSVNWAANAIIWFVLRFRKWKEKGDYYKKSETDSTTSQPDSASVGELPVEIEAEFELSKVPL